MRVLKEDKSNPLVRAIQVINPQMLYAIGPIPNDYSAFIIGDSYLLELALKDILEIKKQIKEKKQH